MGGQNVSVEKLFFSHRGHREWINLTSLHGRHSGVGRNPVKKTIGQADSRLSHLSWIPAYAGMTRFEATKVSYEVFPP